MKEQEGYNICVHITGFYQTKKFVFSGKIGCQISSPAFFLGGEKNIKVITGISSPGSPYLQFRCSNRMQQP
jgi:hypothetical protein